VVVLGHNTGEYAKHEFSRLQNLPSLAEVVQAYVKRHRTHHREVLVTHAKFARTRLPRGIGVWTG
jgi:hypothetical protein